ncbi:hypothetical protein [Streptomyces phaeochromogenes]|uniref:hypothetical protein n=1 Tax=Streptomyces phaeochromogenes TaxID=1923 RepID=UPI003863E648|nr:hypothetical protein OHB08_01615 [Streptomyces phaeochromogenes]
MGLLRRVGLAGTAGRSAVEPVVVAEIAVDVSLDAAGRWRHPVRLVRVRSDLTPDDVPLFGKEA